MRLAPNVRTDWLIFGQKPSVAESQSLSRHRR